MIAGCKSALAWLVAFAFRLLRVAPLQVPASILASLCSQLFQIAAFLLPLKVMILLGSTGVPGYFPPVMIGIERERLILLLAASALMLYLAHLFMDFIGGALARAASDRLILLREEGEAFARQRKVALSSYQGMVTIASGMVLAVAVLGFLGLYKPVLLAVVLGYFTAVFLIGALVFAWSPLLLEAAQGQLSRLIDVVSASGFLLVFGYLVFDYLYGNAQGLLLGILALLLCRQMFSRLAQAVKGIDRLYSRRERILRVLGELQTGAFDDEDSSGFLDESEDQPELLDGETDAIIQDQREPVIPSFLRLIASPQCLGWVREVLAEAGASGVEPGIEQVEAGRRGELALHLTCQVPERAAEHFLFRAFNRQETKRMARAVPLLAVYPGSSAPRLLKVSEHDGFAAHLYEWAEQARQILDDQTVYECREQVFIESCVWPVPDTLTARHQSGSLVERCGPVLWARCNVFSRWAGADVRHLVDAFVTSPQRLQKKLEALPKCLYNPDIVTGNVYALGSSLRAVRWERWSLEPVGSGWPVELGLERLDQAFARACESSEALRHLSPLQVRLAALAFAFEERCAQGRYLSAFTLLRELSDTLDALER